MKKLFLMLTVLFIALCLFVSCDDDSSEDSVVSTWKLTETEEGNGYGWIETYELVLYKDGTFTFVYYYKELTDEPTEEPFEDITEWKGTYTFTSETTGTYSGTDTEDTITGSFEINGDSISMTLAGDEHPWHTLTKV